MNAALDSRQPWLKTPTMGVLTFYTSTHAFLYVPTCAMYVCRCLYCKVSKTLRFRLLQSLYGVELSMHRRVHKPKTPLLVQKRLVWLVPVTMSRR